VENAVARKEGHHGNRLRTGKRNQKMKRTLKRLERESLRLSVLKESGKKNFMIQTGAFMSAKGSLTGLKTLTLPLKVTSMNPPGN